VGVPRNADEGGSRVDDYPVGSPESPLLARAIDAEALTMKYPMVMSAEQDEVVEFGESAVFSMPDVVGVQVVLGAASWPLATRIVAAL